MLSTSWPRVAALWLLWAALIAAGCTITVHPYNGEVVYYAPTDLDTFTAVISSVGTTCSGRVQPELTGPSDFTISQCGDIPIDGTGKTYNCAFNGIQKGTMATNGQYDLYMNLGNQPNNYDIYFQVVHTQTTTTTTETVTETDTVTPPPSIVYQPTGTTTIVDHVRGGTVVVTTTVTRTMLSGSTSTRSACLLYRPSPTTTRPTTLKSSTTPSITTTTTRPVRLRALARRAGAPPGPFPADGDAPATYTVTETETDTVTATAPPPTITVQQGQATTSTTTTDAPVTLTVGSTVTLTSSYATTSTPPCPQSTGRPQTTSTKK